MKKFFLLISIYILFLGCNPSDEQHKQVIRGVISQNAMVVTSHPLASIVGRRILEHTICALGDAAAMPVASFLKHYRDEFQYHIDHGRCLVGGNDA